MKVCHINLAKGFRGGERQTLLLILALAEMGVPQILLARYDSPLHEKLYGIAGLVLVRVKKPYFRALRAVAQHQPDLLHAHDAKAAQWSLLYHWLYKVPYIITRRVPNKLGNNVFTRAVYRTASVRVALSRAIARSIQKLLPAIDVSIVPSMYASFSVNEIEATRIKHQYEGKFVVGHIGALVNRHKGQAVIIEAARILQRSHPAIRFVLLGDGEDREQLQQQAADLENLEFVGFVNDVGNWITAFDLFVFPSFQEGLGSTLLDVMQQTCPIIASDVDGIPDVIQNGENGVLVPVGDVSRFVAEITRLYYDENLRNRLGTAGKNSLAAYAPRRIASCYHKIYSDILDNRITRHNKPLNEAE